jgi:hypothetical protein
MVKVKLGATKNMMILLVQSGDHVTGQAGSSLTITASKDGGAFASISPTVSDRGSGWYSLALTAGNTDTLGQLALHVTAASCDPVDLSLEVVAYDPLSATNLGLSNLDAASSLIKAKTDNLPATPAATGDAMTLTVGAVDAILDDPTEGAYTLRQLARLMSAALAGKISGGGTFTITIRDINDTKNRIVATVDSNGNRTAVTLDAT